MNQYDSTAVALAALDRAPWMSLAVVTPDGAPYCIPVHAAREGNSLYFHCALTGDKVDSLRANPAVCLTAVADAEIIQRQFTTDYTCALVRGTACEVTDETEKIAALRLICQRFTPEGFDRTEEVIGAWLPRTGIWKITITSLSGKEKRHGGEH